MNRLIQLLACGIIAGATVLALPAWSQTDELTQIQSLLDQGRAFDALKQIAAKLGISRHTVADHVKDLHRIFDVNSRGELLARFVRRT